MADWVTDVLVSGWFACRELDADSTVNYALDLIILAPQPTVDAK